MNQGRRASLTRLLALSWITGLASFTLGVEAAGLPASAGEIKAWEICYARHPQSSGRQIMCELAQKDAYRDLASYLETHGIADAKAAATSGNPLARTFLSCASRHRFKDVYEYDKVLACLKERHSTN